MSSPRQEPAHPDRAPFAGPVEHTLTDPEAVTDSLVPSVQLQPQPQRPPQRVPRRSTFVRFAQNKRNPRPTVRMWPDVENPPGPCQMTTEGTHAASQFRVASDNLTVTNDKGYRQAKASHGVAEGTWYYEATLTNTAGAARIGWSQISGDLQGPCGLDHYSYAFRSYPATRFHASVGYTYGERYDSPDVTLGVLIHLPPLGPAAREDLRRRRFILQRDFPYAKFDYVQPLPSTTDESDGGNTTAAAVSGGSPSFTSDLATEAAAPSPLPKMSGSAIVYFRNGRCLSQAYGPLHLGKYHPAVACYMGAEVRLNFGPEFAHPPPAEWEGTPVRPMSECPPENYLEDEAAAR